MITATPWAAQLIPHANAWVVFRIEDTLSVRGYILSSRRVHALRGRLLSRADAANLAQGMNQHREG